MATDNIVADSGDVTIYGSSSSFSTARSTSAGQGSSSAVSDYTGILYNGSSYAPYRMYLKFDTSGISGTITGVTLTLTAVADGSVTDFDVRIVQNDWSAQDPISAGNREAAYDNALTATQDAIWRNTSGMSLNTPYESAAMDTSYINTSGYTYYTLLSDEDYNNSAPTTQEYIILAMADNATASYRPTLNVTYSTAVVTTPPAGVLTSSQVAPNKVFTWSAPVGTATLSQDAPTKKMTAKPSAGLLALSSIFSFILKMPVRLFARPRKTSVDANSNTTDLYAKPRKTSVKSETS